MEGNPPTDSEHHNSSYHSIGHSKLRAWSLAPSLKGGRGVGPHHHCTGYNQLHEVINLNVNPNINLNRFKFQDSCFKRTTKTKTITVWNGNDNL